MMREETVRNLLTELIDMIDNGSQRDLDRADEIGTSILKLFEQEPCEDVISRREALKCLNGAWGDYSVLNEVFERIDKLPSVTPSKEWVRNIHDKEICPYCGKERWSKDV